MSMPCDLTNHFLIAMPNLLDPNFFHTVTYICAHNEDGAMGVVINRPVDIELGEILTHMKIDIADSDALDMPVYHGGPVQAERGFVIHPSAQSWESTMMVTDELSLTSSRDILAAIAKGKGPEQALVALGYAGWQAGQLEQELADNTWLNLPADGSLIFETPAAKRWHLAAERLGVDLGLISTEVGHA